MRYIIDSKDNEGIIGIQIDKWVKQKKIILIEKADPVIEIKERLERISRALDTLKKAGWNQEVMEIYISKKSNVGIGTIRNIINKQEDFFKAKGVITKTK